MAVTVKGGWTKLDASAVPASIMKAKEILVAVGIDSVRAIEDGEEFTFRDEPVGVIFTQTDDGIVMTYNGKTFEVNGHDDLETFLFSWKKKYFNGTFVLDRLGANFFTAEQKACFVKKLA